MNNNTFFNMKFIIYIDLNCIQCNSTEHGKNCLMGTFDSVKCETESTKCFIRIENGETKRGCDGDLPPELTCNTETCALCVGITAAEAVCNSYVSIKKII